MLQYLNPELAQELVMEHTPELRPRSMPCKDALGLTLAEAIGTPDPRFGASDLNPGAAVSALSLGALAAAGRNRVRVVPPPTTAVIQISREHDAPARPLASGQMVAALLRQAGVRAPRLLEAYDTFEDLCFVVDHVIRADLVLFVGVELERVETLQRVMTEFNASVILDNLAQDPGGHFCLAARGARLFFGLGADPMAAALCFEHYVSPAINKMMGRRSATAAVRGRLAGSVSLELERTRLLPARTRSEGRELEVTPLLNGHSNLPPNSYFLLAPGCHSLADGSEVEIWWMTGARNGVAG